MQVLYSVRYGAELESMNVSSKMDRTRLRLSKETDAKKSSLGQFMTPTSVAEFMAALFPPSASRTCRLLDAGAGFGSLTSAFLDRCGQGFDDIELTAFEVDDGIRVHLANTLTSYTGRLPITPHIQGGDFIEHAVNRLQFGCEPGFTHAILNPPYKKINTGSRHRLLLREVGIETVNLYTAFVALAIAMMESCGKIVAIIPRSFCNGPYYRAFREFIFARSAIRHMHLFQSRNKAFKADEVLQENVIIALECGVPQGPVTVSTSTDDTFVDYVVHEHAFDRVVLPGDAERFIHVPTSPEHNALELSKTVRHTLKDIGITVSTGPVVDFRMRDHLRHAPEDGTVPLLYPGHFAGQVPDWPKLGLKKPNAIARNPETERWLYPNGYYAVVRRFSSKEERRRIVASVVEPTQFPDVEVLGFENHLNVLHENRHGLPEDLARGLVVFLNGTAIDDHFRRFNGHTQVNATDLRSMKFPSRAQLNALGRWARKQRDLTQERIDERLSQFE